MQKINFLNKLNINERQWIRILVIAAVLAVSGLVIYKASLRQMNLLFALVVGAIVTLFIIRQPHLGLILLVISSPLVPFEIGTGTATSIHITFLLLLLLLGIWIVDMVVLRREVHIIASPPILPAFLFAVAAILGFFFGQLPWFANLKGADFQVQVGGLAVYLLSVAAFLLVAHQVKDIRWLKWMTYLFVAIAGVYFVSRSFYSVLGFVTRFYQHGATTSVFWTWAVALAFALALLHRKLRPSYRIILAAIVFAALFVGFVKTRSWISGWMPPLVAIAVIYVLAYPRSGSIYLVLVGAFLIIGWNSSLVTGILNREQYSLLSRLEAWRLVTELARINPLFGLGPANYYYYTSINPIWGWYVNFSSHNQFIDILAQSGLVGLFCFAWFVVAISRLGLWLRKRVGDGFRQAYVYGCLGGLAGTLVGGLMADWFLPFVYNVTLAGFRSSVFMWLFLGGLVAIQQIGVDKPEQAEAIQGEEGAS